jgi:hypothetical protein
MPVIVVGGSGRNVGKTALVCGLIAAMPEFRWIAVKVTGHEHGLSEKVWEEQAPGQQTDTARYLTAGAQRAFLLTAKEAELPVLLQDLQAIAGLRVPFIFESNRIAKHLRANVCLDIHGSSDGAAKASFGQFAQQADARVFRGERDRMVRGAKPEFELADFARISIEMLDWLHARLLSDSCDLDG